MKLSLRALLTASALLLLPKAEAGVLLVVSGADSGPGTLRAAIQDAQPGDTLRFQGLAQISLLSPLRIEKPLRIEGPGAGQLSIDGGGLTRLFDISLGDSLTLKGLSLTNGSAAFDSFLPGGGAVRVQGFLRAEECYFAYNAAQYGGAIELLGYDGGQARAELIACTFARNRATLEVAPALPRIGGAVFADSRNGGEAFLLADNCSFFGNEAFGDGGAIYLIADPAGGARLEGRHCTFTQNSARRGGAIENSQAEITYLGNSILAGNTARLSAPDIYGYLASTAPNLLGDTSSLFFYAPHPGDRLSRDPMLGPPDRYGSALPLMPPRCGSPALDAALGALPADARGALRNGPADLGACERIPSDGAASSLADDGYGSLRRAVLMACPGDSLTLGGPGGEILLDSALVFGSDLRLAAAPGQRYVIRGRGSDRLAEVLPGASLRLHRLTFAGGAPPVYGGGAIRNKGRLLLSACTFEGNSAEAGGALANYGDQGRAEARLLNCTFSGNEAFSLDGGAVDNRAFAFGAELEILHCTFSSNQAAYRGGALYNDGGQLRVSNSILAGNSAPAAPNLGGGALSEGHNLLGDTLGAAWQAAAGDLSAADPLLDPLGNYGGSTFTFRLRPGSPAIDAGSSALVEDQRGVARPYQARPDIGAYEFDPSTSSAPALPSSLLLFPNPASGWAALRTALPILELRCLDLRGRLVASQKPLATEARFSVEGWPPGIYCIELQTAEGMERATLSVLPQ
jgi:predicted outer membrane repeat protein